MICGYRYDYNFYPATCDPSDANLVFGPTQLEYLALNKPAQPTQTSQTPQACQTNPFYMTTESALAIGGAMLLCMSVAWVLRMARISLGGSRDPESE